MRPLILASASPRRRQLLALAHWPFNVATADVDETPLPGEAPVDFVSRLSQAKARAVAARLPQSQADPPLVIACDTTVVLDDRLLNKPADAAEARAMLTDLRARTHQVLTGLAVLDTATGALHAEVVASAVPMRAYSEAEMAAYIASGDPLDKAGAYAIQHPHFQPVARGTFVDCFANVMGLPLCHLLRRLRAFGFMAPNLPQDCQVFIPYECPIFQELLIVEC
ncbi:MAG: septum formation protein Maf [Anaerolineales bacterium]|nr:septum formation protein Maf [Anaerolineales bacterium]